MPKRFTIFPASKGLQIIAENEKYYFSSQLFSHSSMLTDQNSNIVGTLKRSSWWRMKFVLNVDGKLYQLWEKAFTTELLFQETGLQFYDLGGGDFFKKNFRVTQCEKIIKSSKGFQVMIRDEEHYLALLIAICLTLNPHINDSGNF